jgi:hypothetical protein
MHAQLVATLKCVVLLTIVLTILFPTTVTGPEATYRGVATIELSSLLRRLVSHPRLAVCARKSGFDIEHLLQRSQGLTVGALLEKLTANTAWLRTRAERLRTEAGRLQQDLLEGGGCSVNTNTTTSSTTVNGSDCGASLQAAAAALGVPLPVATAAAAAAGGAVRQRPQSARQQPQRRRSSSVGDAPAAMRRQSSSLHNLATTGTSSSDPGAIAAAAAAATASGADSDHDDDYSIATLLQVISAVKAGPLPVAAAGTSAAAATTARDWAAVSRAAERAELRGKVVALLRRAAAQADVYQVYF